MLYKICKIFIKNFAIQSGNIISYTAGVNEEKNQEY